MKRAILVLMIVVFALVTVVPTFALSQDFHGLGMSQVGEMKSVVDPNVIIEINVVIDPNDVIDPNEGIIMPNTIVLEEAIIGVLRHSTSSLTVRKAGGEPQQ